MRSRFAVKTMAALAATVLVSACGGGGDGGPAPATPGTPGSPSNPGTPGSTDLVTLADLQACPQVSSPATTTQWFTCLVGKRLPGKNLITGKACELRIKAGGVFEFVNDGAVSTLPAVSTWDRPLGVYQNSEITTGVRLFIGDLSRGISTVNNYHVKISIASDPSHPTIASLNDDTVEFATEYLKDDQTCKLDNI